MIQTYVNIERVRFKNRIRFEYDIPEEVYHLQIPPLLLQPLIENAIRQGIGDRMDGGSVMLTAEKQSGQWKFIITDDGVGIPPDRLIKLLDKEEFKLSQGVGLLNINQRLKFEYGSEITIESELGSGTKVIVQIPDAELE